MTESASEGGGRTLAAVDLGSNSFHMIVSRFDGGQPVVLDRLREHVRLAAGLGPDKRIGKEKWERAMDCLGRFGERLAEVSPENVRAVATNTVRKARNAREFLDAARRALGHDVEVISGGEEARLIYLGVAHSLDDDDDRSRRLVVDVGGGSTELIIGEQFEPLLRDSTQMGCVTYGRRFFDGGRIDARRFDKAVVAAQLEVRSLVRRYRQLGWDRVIGASGTIKAVDRILRANRWSEEGISADGLERLRAAVIDVGHVGGLAEIPGLRAERAPVLPGGLAVLIGVIGSLRIERMTASSMALREGALFDLLGRIRNEDVRDRTIRRLQERYDVDADFAARVEETALHVFEAIRDPWELDRDEGRRFVSWAARLHEIGLTIAHGGHHRHAAYIVRNSDMPGFSRDDQELLAALLLGHRRKVTRKRLETQVATERVELALQLCICLRLARRLNRKRLGKRAPLPVISVKGTRLKLRMPDGWLERHPLTRADLVDEAWVLKATGYRLKVA